MSMANPTLISDAINRFHSTLEQDFGDLFSAPPERVDLRITAALSKALTAAIPVSELTHLGLLRQCKVAEFEQALSAPHREVTSLLNAFLEPLHLSHDTTWDVIFRIHGYFGGAGSAPARIPLSSLWKAHHAAAANRVCYAVGKIYTCTGSHGYKLFINKAYAHALECVLSRPAWK
jgi:hypothetical protein